MVDGTIVNVMGQGRSSVRREVTSNRVLDEPEQHGFKILITNYMAQP